MGVKKIRQYVTKIPKVLLTSRLSVVIDSLFFPHILSGEGSYQLGF